MCSFMPEHPSEEKPTEKKSLGNQIADLIVKAIRTGGIGVGGLGAFWMLFKEGDVPKAIVSAAIGLAVSYGASLLKPLHEGNQRRLESTGKSIDKAVDRGTQVIANRLTGLEEKYFQCQAKACRLYRSEGMQQYDGIFGSTLEEVYVPLQLDISSLPVGLRSRQAMQQITEAGFEHHYQIWDLLKKAETQEIFRQVVILAWGGYGKTTLLKHIAFTYGMNQQGKHGVARKVPFLLVLRKYRDTIAQPNPPSLPELIAQYHQPSLPDSQDFKLSADWVKDNLKRGDAIVLFDGFDEVAKGQRPSVAKWIEEQMRLYGKSVFLLTSRPKAYNEQEAGDRVELSTRLWVRDFDQEMRRDFVRKWYLCQERRKYGEDAPEVQYIADEAALGLLSEIEARPELRDLAKNPLLLNMITTFHRRYPGADLPRRRVELYQEICRLQLRDRPSARKLETLLIHCEAQVILQMLALEMMIEREEIVDRTVLLDRLARYLTEQGESIDAKEFLDQVVQISELLVEREPEEFEFAHLSFQEYLAAVQILQRKQEWFLYERLNDDRWKPTILLYVGLIKNPTALIQEAMQRGATDFAYRCFQETTKAIDPALKKQLTALKASVETSQYQRLEEFLSRGEWEAADNETYRLMITAVGKEEGQYFEPEELLNFPCDALKAIDGLWVKYSNGHFGFSVQKEIYLECGGIPDGQYHEQAWDNFCHANGWRVDNKYVRATFDASSPRGHLPWGGFVGIIGGRFVTLLSHRDL